MSCANDRHAVRHGFLNACGQPFFVARLGVGNAMLDENATLAKGAGTLFVLARVREGGSTFLPICKL